MTHSHMEGMLAGCTLLAGPTQLPPPQQAVAHRLEAEAVGDEDAGAAALPPVERQQRHVDHLGRMVGDGAEGRGGQPEAGACSLQGAAVQLCPVHTADTCCECRSPACPAARLPCPPMRTMVSGNQVLNSWPSTGTSLFMAPIFWKNTIDCSGGGKEGRGKHSVGSQGGGIAAQGLGE